VRYPQRLHDAGKPRMTPIERRERSGQRLIDYHCRAA
jgi:hypothetical protein